jgi:hypothetical protein
LLFVGSCLGAIVACSSSSKNQSGTGGSAAGGAAGNPNVGGTTAGGGSGGASGGSGGAVGGSAGSGGGNQRMFVTSTTLYIDGFTPGLGGADAACEAYAASSPLNGGVWVAVLSDASHPARERIQIHGPVDNTNGERLAENANDLWDGELLASVAYDESGSFAGGVPVWSATNDDGTSAPGDACIAWTDQSNSQVLVGSASSLGPEWIADVPGLCSDSFALYCIEQ